MSDNRPKFSEFVDILLVGLYDADEKNPGKFFDLNALSKALKISVPLDWVFDAGKVLESRLLAQCLYTYGATHGRLTGEGRLYVEGGRGITRKVTEHPEQYFVNIHGNQNQVVVGQTNSNVVQTVQADIETQREPVFREIAEIRKALGDDPTLNPGDKEEAQSLLKIVETELRKPSPRRQLVSAMLDALSKITSIATNVASLMRILIG
jgi:hypothetical protein